MIVFFSEQLVFLTPCWLLFINICCWENRCSTMTELAHRLTASPKMTALDSFRAAPPAPSAVSIIRKSMHITVYWVFTILNYLKISKHSLYTTGSICRSCGCFCVVVHTWQRSETSIHHRCLLIKTNKSRLKKFRQKRLKTLRNEQENEFSFRALFYCILHAPATVDDLLKWALYVMNKLLVFLSAPCTESDECCSMPGNSLQIVTKTVI